MIRQQVFASIIFSHLGRVAINKIVKAIICAIPVISNHASELMQRNILDLRETGRQLFETQGVHVFHLGRIVDETTLQARSHQPMGFGNSTDTKVTKINRKAGIYGIIYSIYGRTDQIKSNLETKLILDNLWFTGCNCKILGIATASVTGQQTENKGLRSLFKAGEGIIGKYIPLQEVIQLNYRWRCHGDRRWGQGELHRQAVAKIGNSTANSIICWHHRRRFIIG